MASTQQHWLMRIIDSDTVSSLAGRIASHTRTVVEGSWGSSTTLLAGALAVRSGRPVLLVVPHLDDADDAVDDLDLFALAGRAIEAVRFGALEVLPGETNVSLDLLAERLALAGRLVSPDGVIAEVESLPHVIVAPIQALMQSIPEPSVLDRFQITLGTGDTYAPSRLMHWLTDAGYRRVDAVEQPGDFAARGGIIDIFPPTGAGDEAGDGPVRLDYFGDEIDTICRVDPDTLGSGDRLKQVRIIGASSEHIQSDEHTTSLLSLLPDECVIVMHEVLELSEQARGYYERLTDPRGIYSPQAVFKAVTARPHVEVNQYTSTTPADQPVPAPVRALMAFDHEAPKAIAELAAVARGCDTTAVVLCQRDAERERLVELLNEHAPGAVEQVKLEVAYLHRGFVWQEDQGPALVLVPHQELFHRYSTRRRLRRVAGGAGTRAADAFVELAVGDYVVHVEHGVARFIGLKTMKRKDVTEEYLTLEFADRALLHVPATQIELVQKYIGGFQGKPPLSKLGGKRWSKQKEQAREAAKELAGELLRVQAARAALPGVRYPADTTWQREFEAEFPYDETEDQLAAIAQVKRDMSDETPMDRLICGDVGFGKTEVAIRAAFKAVEYGKQVAVLVPTTVLAEQHERTFRGRMADYPFKVESLSRFKTAGEQAAVLKKLALGQVDIIIGTHRLLSKDVKFADLGLVIVDEEQRFGVEHKQKLMEYRVTVDVLTLSATPIPRTLHMAMLGLRDISSLSTAPLDRRAIVTEVVPYQEKRIQQAIIRELSRDGQVYFVHNRVHNIQSVADDIHKLVPDARIVIGHGQMPGRELEKVMLKFLRRQADILVSTTIIESGLDIPTANTMFINEADHFGLADLHQLRGRVGRYKHRAYCYLLLPRERPVTDHAAQRLRAIEQYAMLGAGFKIAMRDLEIRGAGNLLGAEQSGHIAAVGYEMYCQLLEQETRKLNHERIIEPVRTHLELPLAGSLPKAYIASDRFRMEAYRRLSRAMTLDELDEVVKDITDAYGELPRHASDLVDLTELRIAASTQEIDSIKLDGEDLIFRTASPRQLDPILGDAPGRTTLIDDRTVYYRPPSNYLEPATLSAVLRKLLVRPLRQSDANTPSPTASRA